MPLKTGERRPMSADRMPLQLTFSTVVTPFHMVADPLSRGKMTKRSQAVITTAEQRPRDGWNDPVHGSISWHTLLSSDIAPTDSMSAGIADLAPGGELKPHRHDPSEIYFVFEGTGIVQIDGQETTVKPGTTVFIPGNAEHGIRNEASANLKFFYVFPTGSFADVIYRFPES